MNNVSPIFFCFPLLIAVLVCGVFELFKPRRKKIQREWPPIAPLPLEIDPYIQQRLQELNIREKDRRREFEESLAQDEETLNNLRRMVMADDLLSEGDPDA